MKTLFLYGPQVQFNSERFSLLVSEVSYKKKFYHLWYQLFIGFADNIFSYLPIPISRSQLVKVML